MEPTSDRAPIRVLVVTNMYPSPDRPSYGAFVRDQVESVRAAGVRCEVLFIDGRTSNLEYLTGIARVRRGAAGPFDLVHAHYGLSGFLAVLQRRLPVLITCHGDDLLGTPGPRGAPTPKSRLARSLTRWAAPRASAVIVVSDELLEALPAGSCRQRAHVLPMGIDLARFAPLSREASCRSLGLDPARRRVLFAADPAKLGKRYALAEAAVGVVRQKLAHADLFVARGFTPDRMPLVMNACDVLVLTSLHEGSPMVVKEAIACGLPIVSVAVGDVAKRIAGVAGCRIADPAPESIARALVEVLYAGVRSDGRHSVEPLAIERVAASLIEIYHGVLGR